MLKNQAFAFSGNKSLQYDHLHSLCDKFSEIGGENFISSGFFDTFSHGLISVSSFKRIFFDLKHPVTCLYFFYRN